MRLIDADFLLKCIKVTPQFDCVGDILKMYIENFPTDKVVEKLENCNESTTFRYNKNEGVLYEVEADVWARIKDGTEVEIKIKEEKDNAFS